MAVPFLVVRLAAPTYVLVWVFVVAFHVVCMAYYAIAAFIYASVNQTFLPWALTTYDLSISITSFPAVAVVHSILSGIHALMILDIIVTSFLAGELRLERSLSSRIKRVRKQTRLRRVCSALFSSTGLFGVASPHFETVFLVRETVQMVLQTLQAYHMSTVLAQTWINWGFSLLLVLNCWATPLVYGLLGHDRIAVSRLVCLLVNMVLDFVSTIALPVALYLPYFHDYDIEAGDFDIVKYYTGHWLINMTNDFTIMIVQSWLDLTQKVLFAINLTWSAAKCRSMLRRQRHHPNAVVDFRENVEDLLHVNSSPNGVPSLPSKATGSNCTKRCVSVIHRMFIVWGIVIFALQIHAMTISHVDSSRCVVPAYPWLGTTPACSLYEIDCAVTGCTGNGHDITKLLRDVDVARVAYLRIRHCPMLEMPPQIQGLRNLRVLRIDNSTIADWSTSAALTQSHHPSLVLVLLTRVNLTRIPDGLLNTDFPHLLRDIEFCVSNLTVDAIPSDLDEHWPQYMWLAMDYTELHEIPDAITRLHADMTLAANHIVAVNESVLRDRYCVQLSRNPIQTLPELPTDALPPTVLYVGRTNLSVLPSWVTPEYVQLDSTTMLAANTPLCTDAGVELADATMRDKLCRSDDQFDCLAYYVPDGW